MFGGYNGQEVLNDFFEFKFEPVSIPPSSFLLDMRGLVNNAKFADVTFEIDGRKIYATK